MSKIQIPGSRHSDYVEEDILITKAGKAQKTHRRNFQKFKEKNVRTLKKF